MIDLILRTLTPGRGSAEHPWSSGSCPWPRSPGNCWGLEKNQAVPWATWTVLTAGERLWSICAVWNANRLFSSVVNKKNKTLSLTKILNEAASSTCLNTALSSTDLLPAYQMTQKPQLETVVHCVLIHLCQAATLRGSVTKLALNW